jgi:hypothetical protein
VVIAAALLIEGWDPQEHPFLDCPCIDGAHKLDNFLKTI